jgi:hypothetical protein
MDALASRIGAELGWSARTPAYSEKVDLTAG